MIINSSAIQLNSRHQFLKHSAQTQALKVWKNPTQTEPSKTQQLADTLSLSHSAQMLKVDKQSPDPSNSLDANQSVQFLIVKQMIKAITGYDFKMFSAAELTGHTGNTNIETAITPTAAQPPSAGFDLAYEQHSVYQESESASFAAAGTINTQDGKSIAFSVQLNMSREFLKDTSSSITVGDPEKKIDPLVINFDGNAAELSQTRFQFDLDANGTTEQIAQLKSGSGYLALDKNNDGVINNGSELFGPHSGNGFSELAQYDSDNNGFIDQADPIYNKLRIWQQHEDGSQQLIALSDKNIGAIYLGYSSTAFQLRSADNQALGEITSTGIYLSENGKTGTIQQINLSV